MVSRLIKSIIITVFIVIVYATAYSQQIPEGYIVIANDIGKKQLSNKEVVEIFKGKYTSWNNNVQTIIVLPSSRHYSSELISKNIFKGSKDVMMKYWLSLVFQGRANPPIFLENDNEIINYVETTSGAIAIIKSNSTIQNSKLIIKIVD